MRERKLRWAMAGMALLGAVVVGVVAIARVNNEATLSGSNPASEGTAGAATPKKDRALRDFMGVGPAEPSPAALSGGNPEFWGSFDFEYEGAKYHVAFFSVATPDAAGVVPTCAACAPDLGAVTYRKQPGGWVVASRDPVIAHIGSNGVPPDVAKTSLLKLGSTPAIAAQVHGMGQGYSVTGMHLLAYRDGWQYVGLVGTAVDNTGTGHCVDDGRCYAWRGDLKVLDAVSNGLPDLQIDREGTVDEGPGGKLQPAEPVIYQFAGTQYQKVEPSSLLALSTGKAQEPTAPTSSSTRGAAPSSGRQWYAVHVSGTSCFRSMSPADRIELIQDFGQRAKTKDLPNGTVEVSEQASAYSETIWTYYPDEATCVASLPSSQPIPSRYR